MQDIDRRLHLCVGRDLFLPARLRVVAQGGCEFLFGDAQFHETLTLLQQTVPARLAALLSQRVPSRDAVDLQGDTLSLSLVFQPTSSALWLLGSDKADGRTRSAVPYTLLCEVRPL